MNDKTHENLSALVDEALTGHELDNTLNDLVNDKEGARATWQRYQLIQDVMHKQYTIPAGDLAERVARAVEDEPYILVPRHIRWLSHSWAKVAVGGSLAATVAIASVLSLRVALVDGGDETSTLAEHNPTINEVIKYVMPTKMQEQAPLVSYPSKESRLNSYIVNHNEYTSTANVHGMLPYMRVIGHEAAVAENEFIQK